MPFIEGGGDGDSRPSRVDRDVATSEGRLGSNADKGRAYWSLRVVYA